jgi:anti-sigma factor ChrR (cupin superfamily)
MTINSDFSRRAVVHADQLDWVQSPMAGVERRMLDRIGDEVARATTIVRYAPGSAFSAHVHTGGEEYLVLDGVFQDEHGDFPAGSYVRNPPQSSHTPRSDDGATILVKLWQFDPDDRTQIHVETGSQTPVADPARSGVSVIPLFKDVHEEVCIEIWSAGATIAVADHRGLEIFVLDGGFSESGEDFVKNSWLRLPVGHGFSAIAAPEGARVWLKRDHLAKTPAAPQV